MDPVFRSGVPSDQEILERMARALRVEDGARADERSERAFPAGLAAALRGDPSVLVWVVELGGRAVGYLAVTLGFSVEAGGRDAFIDELYLEPAVRGRGLGQLALDFAEAECRARGVQRLNLEVERGNRRAKALYEARGFRDHDRHLLSKWL